jgi:GntR family transcriptional regulator, transcriptional repressor for pyruvate dehydrogenase complex
MSLTKTEIRGSRTTEVYAFLLDAISTNEYSAGSKLPPENTLASQLGVSRPVIRETVSRLAAEGLVRAERGRGTFVLDRPVIRQFQFSPIEGINDLIAWQDLRIAIEQEAARLAAERRSSEDLESIRDIYMRLTNLGSVGDRAINLDFEFHLEIAKATQNPVVIEAQRSLGEHIQDWMSTIVETTKNTPSEWREFRKSEHFAIFDAIERMDPIAATQAARRHIENGRTRLLTELSQAQVQAVNLKQPE